MVTGASSWWGVSSLAVIHIHIDPYLADVNVHPTKQEARNFQRKRIDGASFRSYRKESQGTDLIPDALKILAKFHIRTVKNRANHSPT